MSRPEEQPVAGAARAELEGELAVGSVEHLDAVVALVGHGDQVARRGVGDGTRGYEFSVAAAIRSEFKGERGAGGVDVEHLDAVVARVGHGDAAVVRGVGDG